MDIIEPPDGQEEKDDVLESYLMFESDQQEQQQPKTLIVKRMQLLFDDVKSKVINFTDITGYKQLKQQQEVNNLLKTLNTTVHHEMVVPLKVNVELSNRLINQLQLSPDIRKLAETINTSS